MFNVRRMLIDGDIDKIIQHGEERTAELNQKYEGLNFDDLNNFKSDSMLQFEGEDFRNGVCFSSTPHFLILICPFFIEAPKPWPEPPFTF